MTAVTTGKRPRYGGASWGRLKRSAAGPRVRVRGSLGLADVEAADLSRRGQVETKVGAEVAPLVRVKRAGHLEPAVGDLIDRREALVAERIRGEPRPDCAGCRRRRAPRRDRTEPTTARGRRPAELRSRPSRSRGSRSSVRSIGVNHWDGTGGGNHESTRVSSLAARRPASNHSSTGSTASPSSVDEKMPPMTTVASGR